MNYEELKALQPTLTDKVTAALEAQRIQEHQKDQATYSRWQEYLLDTLSHWGIAAGEIGTNKHHHPYTMFGDYRIYRYSQETPGDHSLTIKKQRSDGLWEKYRLCDFKDRSAQHEMTPEEHRAWFLMRGLSNLCVEVDGINQKLAAQIAPDDTSPTIDSEETLPISYGDFPPVFEALEAKHLDATGLTAEAARATLKAYLDDAAIAYNPEDIQIEDRTARFSFGDYVLSSKRGASVEVSLTSTHQGKSFTVTDFPGYSYPSWSNSEGFTGTEINRVDLGNTMKRLHDRATAIIEGKAHDDNDWTQRSIQSLFAELCERVGVDLYQE